jgi:hypothetical protein
VTRAAGCPRFSRALRPVVAVVSLLAGAVATAGEVTVVAAELRQEAPGRWTASVTLRHDDTGWEHYADAWRVVAADGTVYGTRTLYHPHETEQPFTRSLSGIAIPPGTDAVRVEARDNRHGWSPQHLTVDLAAAQDGRASARR